MLSLDYEPVYVGMVSGFYYFPFPFTNNARPLIGNLVVFKYIRVIFILKFYFLEFLYFFKKKICKYICTQFIARLKQHVY